MSNMYGYNDYDGPTILMKNSMQEHYPNKSDDSKKTTATEFETFIIKEDNKVVDNSTTIIKNSINVDHDVDVNDKKKNIIDDDNNNSNDIDYDNPLQVGFWMDGDSLAPPCGTSITMIQQILKIIFNTTTNNTTAGSTTTTETNTNTNTNNDYVCLYDLGCGDGRICFEAYVQYNCTYTIGIEIEVDLIERAQYLLSKLQNDQQKQKQQDEQKQYQKQRQQSTLPVFIQADLQDVLNRLVVLATNTVKEKEQTNAKSNRIEIISEQNQQQEETNRQVEAATKTTNSSKISIDTLPLPTIIVLYLLPESLELLRPNLILLLQYCTNLQIVCNTWCIPNLPYTYEYEIRDDKNNNNSTGSSNTSIVTSIFVYTKECLLSL